jgi:hypothetical protein
MFLLLIAEKDTILQFARESDALQECCSSKGSSKGYSPVERVLSARAASTKMASSDFFIGGGDNVRER